MLYFTITGLLLSAFFAIFYPKQIQEMALYRDQEVLIVDWGIYALMLGLILIYPQYMYEILLLGLGMSFCYNVYMYQYGSLNPDGKFTLIANTLNFLAIMEILYFINNK